VANCEQNVLTIVDVIHPN